MSSGPRRPLTLIEGKPRRFEKSELPAEIFEEIWRRWGTQVAVEWPSPKTEGCWELRSDGWVGRLPVVTDLEIQISPKCDVNNLFRMLEYAYRLKVEYGSELVGAATVDECFEQLAVVLAKRVLDRTRKGLQRTYWAEHDSLPYVRGSIDLNESLRRPWSVRIPCRYQEHTADVEENRILAWTLERVARSGLCSARTLPTIRKAFHALHGVAASVPITAQACVGRSYDRLNEDYRALHALCRFFLDGTGPRLDAGDRASLPFVLNLAKLFEMFVAEWLMAHLPADRRLQFQQQLSIGDGSAFDFYIDMVVFDRRSSLPVCVIDAKYKTPEKVGPEDFNQVVVYAKGMKCRHAFLVYPQELAQPLDVVLDDIRVRSLAFPLDAALDASGRTVLEVLATLDGQHRGSPGSPTSA